MRYLIVVILSVMMFAPSASAAIWANFEDAGREYYDSPSQIHIELTGSSFRWEKYQGASDITIGPNYGFVEIDKTQGVLGSDSSMKWTVTGGDTSTLPTVSDVCDGGAYYANKQAYLDDSSGVCDGGIGGGTWYTYYKDPDSGGQVGFSGTNRLTFWVKSDTDYTRINSGNMNYNMHFGTYTRDPAGAPYSSSDNQGRHLYHHYNLSFDADSGYWTKIYVDDHPQDEVSGSSDPGVNPTAWNYFEGFSRFYFKGKAKIVPSTTFALWLDRYEAFNDTESNATTVASLAISRLDIDSFRLDWQSHRDQYNEAYEVRYSVDELNLANVGSAVTVGTYTTGGDDYKHSAYVTSGDLSIAGVDTVYFAIQQTDNNIGLWYFASYELTDAAHECDTDNLGYCNLTECEELEPDHYWFNSACSATAAPIASGYRLHGGSVVGGVVR